VIAMIDEIPKVVSTKDIRGNNVNLDIRSINTGVRGTYVYFKVDGKNDILEIGSFNKTYPNINE